MRLGQQPNGIGHRRKYNTPHSCIAPGCIRGFHMLVRRSARWSHCCYCRHCCRCRCCLRPMSLQCGDTSTSARQSLTRSRLADVPRSAKGSLHGNHLLALSPLRDRSRGGAWRNVHVCAWAGVSPSPTEISLKSVVFVLSLLNESESRRQVCYAKAINM